MARERERRDREDSEFTDKLVHINRVAKVVKGGRRFGFAALVIVGDTKGRVGFGHGKAREVPEAIRKATEAAKHSLIRVPLREGRTLHHDVAGRHGAGRVYLRAAPPGTGIIAGRPAPAASICAPPLPVPGSSPAARCAPCSRRSACRTWWRSRLARPTPTTWCARPSMRSSIRTRRGRSPCAATSRCLRCRPAAAKAPTSR